MVLDPRNQPWSASTKEMSVGNSCDRAVGVETPGDGERLREAGVDTAPDTVGDVGTLLRTSGAGVVCDRLVGADSRVQPVSSKANAARAVRMGLDHMPHTLNPTPLNARYLPNG